MPVRLPVVFVPSSQRYTSHFSPQTTIGQIARYLSHIEPHIDLNTLQIARPVALHDQLQTLDLQSGDCLTIILHPPQIAEAAPLVRAGDKILTLIADDHAVSSRGKHTLIVGKSSEANTPQPDVDLREFLPPHVMDFISRQCLRLMYDPNQHQWLITRAGNTHVLLDDFELTGTPIALKDRQTLYFYRASDDPHRPNSRPLGQITALTQTITPTSHDASSGAATAIQIGDFTVGLQIGYERDKQNLRASESLTIETIITRLAAYHQLALTSDTQLYLTRVLAPDNPLSGIRLTEGAFLYAALNRQFVRNLLVLHDISEPQRLYAVTAGSRIEESVIGCRLHADVSDPAIQLDLYDAITAAGHDPVLFNRVSSKLVWVWFDHTEHIWWMRLDERAALPIYINDTRLLGDVVAPLASGDILSFGPRLEDYYVRLEVEITTKQG